MRKLSKSSLMLSVLALGFLAAGLPAKAEISFDLRVGGPPPHHTEVVVERPWSSPGYGAVWVQPHYDWVGDQWVWVHGYYEYPPRPGMMYTEGAYEYRGGEHHWHPGHWH
jgi:hypothetical protein